MEAIQLVERNYVSSGEFTSVGGISEDEVPF